MLSVTIQGTVTDSAGVVYTYSTVANQDNLTATASVVPATAVAGTTRTLTVTPANGQAPYTFGTPTATGITFTPTGTAGQWTFVY